MTAVRLPFCLDAAGARLHGSRWAQRAGEAPRVLALHGGGQATHRGTDWLLGSLAERGWSGAGFDFVGHGETGGKLEGSSLAHRIVQAHAVAQALKLARPGALVASSMGGHIACRLIDALQPQALVLFCPAAYETAAEALPFGPDFQGAIRAATAFDGSPAFTALERFEGRLLLVLGTQDAVIPPAVVHGYCTRARAAQRVEVLRLEGVGHHLHRWLADHPRQADHVLERVAAALGGTA